MTEATLEQRMADAGMVPLSDMLTGTEFDKWRVHTGVQDIPSFLAFAEKKYESYTRMFIEMKLDRSTDDEFFEWVLAHKAVWGDVVFNMRAALERSQAKADQP